jgi:glutathione peroxidase
MLRNFLLIVVVVIVAGVLLRTRWIWAADVVKEPSAPTATTQSTGPLSFTLTDIDGKPVDLSTYRGSVVLIVNTASRCGFTKQYAGLEKLYRTYKDQGFVVIGVPANNFGGQEPGTDEEIKAFCSTKYDVTFPMMSKLSVKGDDKTPLYKYLTEPATAGDFAGEIGWNFTKFLVDRNGNLMARFESKTSPEDAKVATAIEKALARK